MGVVHRGTLMSSAGERPVAIKQLAERGRLDPQRRARLIAEARLVFRLTHANVCQVLDLGEGERGTFVVMELVRGCDLRALLDRLAQAGARLDAACALYVAREVARGLDYAHRFRAVDGAPLGLVHGDVTPQNVLLSIEGEVKLADFGIAHALDEAAPGTGLFAGTPGYMAPELARGQRDHRVDIYALGVTLLVTLTGLPPLEALRALPGLARLRPDVTAQLGAILARAVAASPEQRYLSAAELERELSTELARRHPTFTPSLLAQVVRAHAPARPGDRKSHDTLFSMTVVDVRTPEDAAAASSAAASASATAGAARPSPHGTQTAHTAAVAPRRARIVMAAIAVALAATTLLLVSQHAARPTGPSPSTGTTPLPGAAAAAGAAMPAELPSPEALPAAAAPPPSASPSPPSPAPSPASPSPSPSPPSSSPSSSGEPHPRPSAPPRPPAGERRAHAASPSHRHAEPARPTPVAEALLTVNASPWGAVLIDGREVAHETPLYRHALPAGDHLVLVRFADGSRSAPARVHLAPGELRTLGFSR